jgi:hypothetical protein
VKSFNTLAGLVAGDEPDDMEPVFAHHATLRIFSEAGLDFEELRATLGLTPTTTGRRGERVGPRSPANKGDIWMYRAAVSADRDLHEHIDALWEALKPSSAFIRGLKERTTVQVFLGYSSNIDHAGINIPVRSLEMFTTLELDFGLNIVVQVSR